MAVRAGGLVLTLVGGDPIGSRYDPAFTSVGLHTVDVSSGAVAWVWPFPMAGAAAKRGTLILSGDGTTVVIALDAPPGIVALSSSNAAPVWARPELQFLPCSYDNLPRFLPSGSFLYKIASGADEASAAALDAATGATLWSVPTDARDTGQYLCFRQTARAWSLLVTAVRPAFRASRRWTQPRARLSGRMWEQQ